MTTVLILDSEADAYHRHLREAGIPAITVLLAGDPARLPEGAESAEVVLAPPGLLIDALPRLKGLRWAQSTWAGVETLLAPELPRDYQLSGVKGVFGQQMAEYTLCYMLAHERQVIERYASQKEKHWDHRIPGSLAGKHAVFLGMGSIGRECALRCLQFGMRISAVTRSGKGSDLADRHFAVEALPSALADADYLVMSLPGTPDTRRLVDAGVLACLPPHAVIINVGRGGTLDEQALMAALKAGRLAGAVLDVFELEPLPEEHGLWSCPGVTITAHTSAVSFVELIAPLFIDNLRRYLDGELPEFLVDFARGY
jgi:phosphoglycerate dehydrogenase-like enzyme